MEWCTTHEHVIMHTWFQHHQRHFYTWKSPGDCVRNQNDYITINRKFRNSIHQVKGYPGADCGSDYVPLVATMKVRLRAMRMRKTVKRLHTTRPTSRGAVTAVTNCCANCVEPIYRCLGKPATRTRWMVGAAPHKSG